MCKLDTVWRISDESLATATKDHNDDLDLPLDTTKLINIKFVQCVLNNTTNSNGEGSHHIGARPCYEGYLGSPEGPPFTQSSKWITTAGPNLDLSKDDEEGEMSDSFFSDKTAQHPVAP